MRAACSRIAIPIIGLKRGRVRGIGHPCFSARIGSLQERPLYRVLIKGAPERFANNRPRSRIDLARSYSAAVSEHARARIFFTIRRSLSSSRRSLRNAVLSRGRGRRRTERAPSEREFGAIVSADECSLHVTAACTRSPFISIHLLRERERLERSDISHSPCSRSASIIGAEGSKLIAAVRSRVSLIPSQHPHPGTEMLASLPASRCGDVIVHRRLLSRGLIARRSPRMACRDAG